MEFWSAIILALALDGDGQIAEGRNGKGGGSILMAKSRPNKGG